MRILTRGDTKHGVEYVTRAEAEQEIQGWKNYVTDAHCSLRCEQEDATELAGRLSAKLWECSTLRHGMFTPPEFRRICETVIRDELAIPAAFNPPPSIPTMKAEPTNAERLPGEYLAAYRRAMKAMHDVIGSIHDLPAPESESVTWGSVADMNRIASDLEAVTRYAR